ncbi:MAG: hypothetical protein HFE78_00410 [Clostridiales bacterium]|nr:hypothetical protein [Clostridiales bacterium]
MNRKRFLRIGGVLAALCLSLFLCGCGNQSGLSEEEIQQTVRRLIEEAAPLNEIFFGEGLPVEDYDEQAAEESAVAFHYVPVRADAPYQSVDEIKEAAGKVFAKSYLAGVYENAFEGTEEVYRRYAEGSEGRLTKNVKQTVKTTDEWTAWDFDSIKIKAAKSAVLIVEIDGRFAGRTETEQIVLEKENEGWRLASPTY